MKLCPKCHTENNPDANYCDKCRYQLATPPRVLLCPAGKHPMDPAWSRCPYCQAAQGKSNPLAAPTTILDNPIGPDVGREMVFPGRGQEAVIVGTPYRAGRRIVGLLVTYSWRREGLLFPVYEGRNYLGCDQACEISVPTDDQLSQQHATIIYRGHGFELCDEKSLNGTWMNGKAVSLRGEPLENYAEFKTGQTDWKFISLNTER